MAPYHMARAVFLRRRACDWYECIGYNAEKVCLHHGLPFIHGHALYMKAICGGKSKNDKIDSLMAAANLPAVKREGPGDALRAGEWESTAVSGRRPASYDPTRRPDRSLEV